MNRPDAAKLAAITAAYWPRWSLPPNETDLHVMLEAWARLCADVPVEAMIAALDSLAAEGREFAPPIGAVRARAVDLIARAMAEDVPDVDQAWSEVRRRAADVGFHAAIGRDWSHPAVRQAVEAIGWRRLCLDENESTLFAQFRDVYGKAAHRARMEQTTPAPTLDLVANVAAKLNARRLELGAGT